MFVPDSVCFRQACVEALRSVARAILCLALCTLALGFSATAKEPTIITFDVPGAGAGYNQGTVALCIIPGGAITGYYFGADNLFHGFLRARHGAFTTFDGPGAVQTRGVSINPEGTITGFYVDASRADHGFLRPGSLLEILFVK